MQSNIKKERELSHITAPQAKEKSMWKPQGESQPDILEKEQQSPIAEADGLTAVNSEGCGGRVLSQGAEYVGP